MISLENFTKLAHRTASRYSHRSEPGKVAYTFLPHTLADFHRLVCEEDATHKPPHETMTAEEARSFQDWAGMDGACAFHLIERHASGWDEVARMMQAWLDANKSSPTKTADQSEKG